MLRPTKQVVALPPPTSPAAGCSRCFRSSPLTLGNTAEISFSVKSARIMVAQHPFRGKSMYLPSQTPGEKKKKRRKKERSKAVPIATSI